MAAAVCLAVATKFQMNCVIDASICNGIDRVTGLVRSLIDLEALAAILKHLRHEGEFLQSAVLVERSEDLILAPHFYPVACAQCHRSHR